MTACLHLIWRWQKTLRRACPNRPNSTRSSQKLAFTFSTRRGSDAMRCAAPPNPRWLWHEGFPDVRRMYLTEIPSPGRTNRGRRFSPCSVGAARGLRMPHAPGAIISSDPAVTCAFKDTPRPYTAYPTDHRTWLAMEQLVFAGYHVPWSDHRGYELDPLVASLMSLTAT